MGFTMPMAMLDGKDSIDQLTHLYKVVADFRLPTQHTQIGKSKALPRVCCGVD